MRRIFASSALRELLRPVGQILIFIAGTGLVLSLFILVVALILRFSPLNQAYVDKNIDLIKYTLVNLPQVIVDGVTIGFVYATIALGYTMVYGVLEFINFAHSEIFAVGAFVGVEILIGLDNIIHLGNVSALVGFAILLFAILMGMAASGALATAVEFTAYRPLRGAPRLVPLISAVGVSFFLQDAIRLVESLTTGQFYRVIPTFGDFDTRVPLAALNVAGANVELNIQVKSIVVIVAAVAMMMGLNYLVNVTKIGKAIRSVAQDRTTASLMGIDVNRVISMTFLIGGSLGGAAGLLYALKFTRIDPFVGFIPGIKAFTAAVVGGIGNITGALLGGMILGLLETFAGAFLPVYTLGVMGAEYINILAFLILILVLIFRPSGLLGEQVGQKA